MSSWLLQSKGEMKTHRFGCFKVPLILFTAGMPHLQRVTSFSMFVAICYLGTVAPEDLDGWGNKEKSNPEILAYLSLIYNDTIYLPIGTNHAG
jgi:hypothetical protein